MAKKKMTNNMHIAAMSQDLYRVGIGYHQGSVRMAKIFSEQVLVRIGEIKSESLKPYMRKILLVLPSILEEKDQTIVAENSLMYSVLLQNYAVVMEDDLNRS